MKRFLGTFTSRFNRRHQIFGHLFSGRYKALVVDSPTPGLSADGLGRMPVTSRS
jgi:hypothetical protein